MMTAPRLGVSLFQNEKNHSHCSICISHSPSSVAVPTSLHLAAFVKKYILDKMWCRHAHVCMCACACVCVCVHVMLVCVRACTCVRVYACVYVRCTCMYVCVRVCTYMYDVHVRDEHNRTHTYTHTDVYNRTSIPTYTHVHTRTRTYMYIVHSSM